MDEDGGYTREDLDHLFRTVPSALAFLDREGRVVRVNSRFASLTGKPIEAHAGRTLREIAPQLAAQLAPANRKIIEEGDPVVTIEVQDIGRRADDDGRMHRAHCYPLTSRDGTVRGMSIVIDKIADQGSAPARRQNRAERGEAPSPGDGKALNRAVLNSLQDHVAVVDRAGNILAVNEAWKRFARENGGEAEVLGKGVNYLEVCRHAAGNSDKVAARALEGIQAVLVGSTHNFKMEYLCSSARAERCFVMKVVPLNHREGGAVITHTDITQRKAAEGILAEREQQLRIMADSLPVLIAYVDADQRYQFHNVAYERFFGVSREEIIGHTVSEVLGEAAYAEVRDDIRRALSGE
jgi:PAS domain S-box-containing protein